MPNLLGYTALIKKRWLPPPVLSSHFTIQDYVLEFSELVSEMDCQFRG
uniref:Uncharacterized protein n=1 Tax=Candidatus Kentrum sp. TUN TaxID=2126343 RepID=A0A450ZN02_9GAMM|nr:MAG: hypothetical protein BECKTUN1418F_GA0071002_10637 [Candidatus Kentron sp. TUN]VFK58555.1 MAG: hypothetical protein BECKTUN1418D_GA0071000_10859 [Candidatus Kentron sp. TUN]VFK61057.1 MAG: hypothetical protein BECKTUN1418E_GA0071001_10617 [Candidatus Kentron sp. TUN]